MRVSGPGLLVASLIATSTGPARAQPKRELEPSADRYELSARSETYAELFRRALAGPEWLVGFQRNRVAAL